MPESLTNQAVKQMQPQSQRFWVADTRCPGLTLAVYPSGTKTYYYRYKNKGSRKNNSVKIGNAALMAISEARNNAKAIMGDIAKGFDPVQRQREKLEAEQQKKNLENLRLFNYIEKYYEPYAKQHNASHKEIVNALKREFDFIKNKHIHLINEMDIERWRKRRAKQVTFARLQRIFTYLKACINTAVKHYKLIEHFELKNYTLKRRRTDKVNPPKIRYLTKAEEARLLATLQQRDQNLRDRRTRYLEWHQHRSSAKKKPPTIASYEYPDHITPIIILAYQTGLDLGDIFDLDWKQHVDFPNNQIRKIRNKTMHNQNNPQPVVIPMTPRVREVLLQWGKQHQMDGRVFISPKTGGRLDNINKAWRTIKDDANLIDFRFKDFRHTFASWLAIGGTPLLVIRDLMGHKNIKTTEVYAHLCPAQKSSALANIFTLSAS